MNPPGFSILDGNWLSFRIFLPKVKPAVAACRNLSDLLPGGNTTTTRLLS